MNNISLILLLAATLITLSASMYIKTNYRKYLKVNVSSKKSGYDVAREILDKNGLSHILIIETQGELTDHYDPNKKVVKLSHDIYHGYSVASVSVAAHECGHALQDKDGYVFLKFRSSIVPLVNFASKMGYIAIMFGFLFGIMNLLWLGIAFEIIILLFQVVTLPVEFDASSRALKKLNEYYMVNEQENAFAKTMLTSAALTYVASLVSTILELLRLLLIASRRD